MLIDNLSTISSIVTSFASVFSLIGICITLWFNYRENRTKRYVEIITKHTLYNNTFVRNNNVLFTTLTRPEVIDEARLRNDLNYKYKLVRCEASLEVQFKYLYPIERRIIMLARRLCKLCILYYDKPSAFLGCGIRKISEQFYGIMTVFDYADWLYIKGQARTKAYNKSVKDFTSIYNGLLDESVDESFKQADKPTPW